MGAGNQYSIARMLIQSLIHCYFRGHFVKCLLGQAHIEMRVDAGQDTAGQGDTAQETPRDTV
jgi:hypothetical protein